ncbi:unnamed protein product [Closterium sp. NIES-54]
MVEQILTRVCFPFFKVWLTPLAVDHGLTALPSDEPFDSNGLYPELVCCLICEAEVFTVAMAAQELRWLSFLLTDLGERPRSHPILFADNRSAVLLCEEPRLVGKAKHIQLRYFLLRELQQRGQALVQRVVSEANTADVFTKALPPLWLNAVGSDGGQFSAVGSGEERSRAVECGSVRFQGGLHGWNAVLCSFRGASTGGVRFCVVLCRFVPFSAVQRVRVVDYDFQVKLVGLHLPSFLTNLVSNAALQDVWVDPFTLGGQRVAICQVAASSRVSASSQLAASCSCQVLSHQTLLWHHRLGHPSLPHLRTMHSRLLVSVLPRSLPSLPRSPAQPCLPCIEGRQCAAPHSSEFPPTIAPLQTLHMDVWGPAPISGTDQERYFLLVVDDYVRYTTVFPLRRKADVSGVLIAWIRATRHQLREWFRRDLPVLRLHFDRGGEFSFDLLEELCQDEGIRQTFTLPASPQQNGIAERRIGLIMEVARTSMIHAAATHFLWPFAVRYAAHQLNLWPCVSEPETLPTLQWTGKVGDASGPAPSGVSQVDPPPLVEPLEISSNSSGPAEGGDPAADDTAATRRSPRLETPPGFPPLPSLPPPQPVAVDSGVETAGAETEGEGSRGAATGGATTGGTDSGGAASPSGGGAVGDPAGGPRTGQPPQLGLLATLSLLAICAWIVWRGSPGGGGYGPIGAGTTSAGGTAGGAGGAAGAGVTRAASPGGIGGAVGAGGARATSPGGATGAGGAGAAGTEGAGAVGVGGAGGAGGAAGAGGDGAANPGGAGGAGGGGGAGAASTRGARAASAGGAAGAGGAGAATTGGTAGGATSAGGAGANTAGDAASAGGAGPAGALRHLLGLPPAPTEFLVAGTTPPLLFPQLLPHSPLPALGPYTAVTESLTERREPETRASTPERRESETRASIPARVHRVRRPRASADPGTHDMTLRPSSVPQGVVLPSPPVSSLHDVADPPSDLTHDSSPTVTRLLAIVVTDPTFSSPAASALVAELVDFAATRRLNYLASLVSDPNPICPPSVGGEVGFGCDVLEDREEELECLAAAAPHLATMLLAPKGDPAMDAEMASSKSTGTYVDEVAPPGAKIVSGMWIFSMKRPQGSPPAFKARYVARGFSQREGVDFFRKMTTLWAPREWHDTLRTTLATLGFAPSSTDPSLFLRTDTTLPPFYVLVYVDVLVFAIACTEALALVKVEVQERHTCTDLDELRSYLGLQITRHRARRTITLTQSHMVQQVL